METYTHSQFPPHISLAHVALYTFVTNAPSLRARIINAAITQGDEGNRERDAVNFAFIDARLVSRSVLDLDFAIIQYSNKITSRLHLQTAIYQAILAESQGTLRTKTVHSEVLWALNPSNNVRNRVLYHDLTPMRVIPTRSLKPLSGTGCLTPQQRSSSFASHPLI